MNKIKKRHIDVSRITESKLIQGIRKREYTTYDIMRWLYGDFDENNYSKALYKIAGRVRRTYRYPYCKLRDEKKNYSRNDLSLDNAYNLVNTIYFV